MKEEIGFYSNAHFSENPATKIPGLKYYLFCA
jgi:hypothetical protein